MKGERFFKFVISFLSFFGEVLFKFLFTCFIVRFGGISFRLPFFIDCNQFYVIIIYVHFFCIRNLLEFCLRLVCEYLDFVLVFWVLLLSRRFKTKRFNIFFLIIIF